MVETERRPSARRTPARTSVPIASRLTTTSLAEVAAIALSVLAYAVVLQVVYRTQIAPEFAVRGLTYRTPEPWRLCLSVVLVAVVACCLPRRLVRISDHLQWLPFIIAGAPSILLPQYMTALSPAEATRMAFAVAGSLLLCRALTVGSLSLRPMRPRPSARVWAALVAGTVLFYLYTASVAGLPLRLVSIAGGYDVRSDFATVSAGTLVPRLLPAIYNVVNPIFIARGVLARRPALLLFGVGGQLLIFLWEAQKSVLFSVPTVIAMCFLLRRGPVRGYYAFVVATVVCLGSVLIDWLLASYTLTTLFVRRFLVVPGALTVGFVRVFADRPKGHFSELGLGNPNAYIDLDPAFLVGREFVNDPTTHANVNIWGHGYMSFGYIGMFLVAVMYAAVLLALDAASEDLPSVALGAIAFPMAVVIASANLFTSFLTHGIWALLLILPFLPRDGWRSPPPPVPTGAA